MGGEGRGGALEMGSALPPPRDKLWIRSCSVRSLHQLHPASAKLFELSSGN